MPSMTPEVPSSPEYVIKKYHRRWRYHLVDTVERVYTDHTVDSGYTFLHGLHCLPCWHGLHCRHGLSCWHGDDVGDGDGGEDDVGEDVLGGHQHRAWGWWWWWWWWWWWMMMVRMMMMMIGLGGHQHRAWGGNRRERAGGTSQSFRSSGNWSRWKSWTELWIRRWSYKVRIHCN